VSLRDARAGRWPVLTREGDLSSEAAARRARHQGPGATCRARAAADAQRRAGRAARGGQPPRAAEVPRAPLGDGRRSRSLHGCGACVVACYAENNIPVVGRDQVLKGRELSWLRIEKHVFGAGSGRQVRFLPVMCQHCAQAPCETVCPVFAAYHTPDGLNAQIYNRCIGTRYCANNCPYKVRRFNYFDWPREQLATQQLQPRRDGPLARCDGEVHVLHPADPRGGKPCPSRRTPHQGRRDPARPACRPARRGRSALATSSSPPGR